MYNCIWVILSLRLKTQLCELFTFPLHQNWSWVLTYVFYMLLPFNCSFIIDYFHGGRIFALDLNISACFESNNECEHTVPIFTQTVLPKVSCSWLNGFNQNGKIFLTNLLIYINSQGIFNTTLHCCSKFNTCYKLYTF
jgi:hypothetical protein